MSLDFSDQDQVFKLTQKIDPSRCRLKVGKELFTHAGPTLVEKLIEQGFDIFLDLKYHDIPTTVAKACCIAAEMGVWMINVHASGGVNMMRLVRETIDKQRNRPLVIGVTVLTSMNDADLGQLGINKTVIEQVIHLAGLTEECGLDGVVCSSNEVSNLRKEFGNDFCLVTPGIRPEGIDQNDQQRIMTPAQAIIAGSDYLVVGRPITRAADPLKALEAIENEIMSI